MFHRPKTPENQIGSNDYGIMLLNISLELMIGSRDVASGVLPERGVRATPCRLLCYRCAVNERIRD